MIVALDLGGKLYLNSVLSRTDCTSFDVNSIEHDQTTNVSTRTNALGEQQAVSTPGMAKGAKVALNFCTDDQVAWLKAHQGQPVWYRDPRGERFAAFYTPDSGYQPRFIDDSWVVPLTFTAYEQPEAV